MNKFDCLPSFTEGPGKCRNGASTFADFDRSRCCLTAEVSCPRRDVTISETVLEIPRSDRPEPYRPSQKTYDCTPGFNSNPNFPTRLDHHHLSVTVKNHKDRATMIASTGTILFARVSQSLETARGWHSSRRLLAGAFVSIFPWQVYTRYKGDVKRHANYEKQEGRKGGTRWSPMTRGKTRKIEDVDLSF